MQKSHQLMLQQQEARYKQEIATMQLELDLKGDQVSDLQGQVSQSQGKERALTGEIEKLKVELQKALEKATGNQDKKTIEQLSMMFEKKSSEIIEYQERLGSMQNELNKQKTLVVQLTLQLEEALDPKKKKKK